MEDILLLTDFCLRQLSLLALSSAPQNQKTLGRVVILLLGISSSKLQQVFAMGYDLVMVFDSGNDDDYDDDGGGDADGGGGDGDDDDDNNDQLSISRDVGSINLGSCTTHLVRETTSSAESQIWPHRPHLSSSS